MRDWPELAWRGTVEGFYGPPWSHEERLDHLRFAGRRKLNSYVYAPKDDPYHRQAWREPYPADELARLAELVEVARENRVRLVYALAPGLSMRFSGDADNERLHAKAAQLWDIGVRDIALLFDDIPTELSEPADLARFGAGPGGAGAAHGSVCARFVTEFLAPRGHDRPLLMVPTDYAGLETSAYREQLAATLPADALVWWTGHDIVVGEVTREHVDRAAATYGRRLLLWDNFPVNDFDRARLFLGPLQGRTTSLDGSALAGISANPMIEAAASQVPLATVADYAWNPGAYDPASAAERALAAVAGPDAAALAPLVEACSSWPPGDPQSARVLALTEATLSDDPAVAAHGARALHDELAPLAGARELTDSPLATQLRPWAVAGSHMAQAGRAAAALVLAGLGNSDATVSTDDVRDLEAALRRAEQHYPNVLRDLLSPFVREVLRRRGYVDVARPGGVGSDVARSEGGRAVSRGPEPAQTTGAAAGGTSHPAGGARHGTRVLVLTGPEPHPGEVAVAELLRKRGVGVVVDDVVARTERAAGTSDDPRRAAAPDDAATGPGPIATQPAAVVVTRSAAPDQARAAARLSVPLLAWAHLVDLGLAGSSGVELRGEHADVIAPGHPLAGGAQGRVRLFPGPTRMTWGEPGPAALVVARTIEEGRPTIFTYRAGDALADGSTAPADRTAVFLAREALAPWLRAPSGTALVEAALDELVPART
ncbi:hypothetical protein GB881_06155 [Georgenia subflava]|uniref:GH84 domain-containing protein n=1 Tax=Georgenia subflava TaxID=1622177 RepID=A0A6N7EE00_9MICO|nr:hypothetical protein [Georgenia subflava]